MQCTNMIWLEDKNILVPCRKCIACRISRVSDWTTRMIFENEVHESSCFITLTYAQEALPFNMELDRKELQRFFKRLRKNTGRKIKYFACGEYGEKNKRPHYHAIIFGIGVMDHWYNEMHQCEGGPVFDSWNQKGHPRGFVTVTPVHVNRMRYCAKYLLKGTEESEQFWLYQGPFQFTSKGLGLEHAEISRDRLVEDQELVINGRNRGIPKYFKDKLGIEGNEIYCKVLKEKLKYWKEKGYEIGPTSWSGRKPDGWLKYAKVIEDQLKQIDRNLTKAEEMKRRSL